MRNTKKGFTLVELLVVIAILAILATVSVVGYTSFIDRANDSVAQQELTQIRDYVIAQEYLGGVTVNQALVDELGLEGTLEEGTIDNKTCYRYTLNKGVAYWLTEKNEVKVDLTGWTASAPVTPPAQTHECESKCATCGGCTDAACVEDACADKCECTQTPAEPVMLSFNFTVSSNCTSIDANKQVWNADGITVTNTKGSSTTNVNNYTPTDGKPARFYKNSDLTISCEGKKITKIVLTCDGTDYDDIPSIPGATITKNGSVVTITFETAVESVSVKLSTEQIRAKSMDVYTVE